MANPYVVPRNFWEEATLTTELAPVTGYPISNTKDTQRSRVWRSTSGANQYINWTFDDGLERIADHFSFYRHRCHGGSVRTQLFANANWTSQVLDSTAVPVINVVPTEGLDWGINPYGTGRIDPFITDAPYWWDFTPTGHLSGRTTFESNVATYGYAYWQACHFFLGLKYQFPYNVAYDNALRVVDQTDKNRSRGGSLRSNVGPSWKEFSAELKRLPVEDQAGWLDIQKNVGTGRDFVLSVFPGLGTRRERDHIINCEFKSLSALSRWHLHYLSKRIEIEEV